MVDMARLQVQERLLLLQDNPLRAPRRVPGPRLLLKTALMSPFGERIILGRAALLLPRYRCWPRLLLYNPVNLDSPTRVAIPVPDTRQRTYRPPIMPRRIHQLNQVL